MAEIEGVADPEEDVAALLAALSSTVVLNIGTIILIARSPFSDVAVHPEPIIVSSHPGGVGTLHQDKRGVVRRVPVEARLDIQVAAERCGVLELADGLLEAREDVGAAS